MRKRPSRSASLLAALPLLLPLSLSAAGCTLLDDVPPRPAAIEDQATADAPFPSLAAVPARPRLTYTLEQRREIAEGLVADRANARHAGDALRRAQGRPVQPDTAPPLPPAATPASPPAGARQGDLALAYAEEALARDSDDGSLGDFLDRLQQRPPAVADIQPEPVPLPQRGVPLEPRASDDSPAPPAVGLADAQEPEAAITAPGEALTTEPQSAAAVDARTAAEPVPSIVNEAATPVAVAAAVPPAAQPAREIAPSPTLPLSILFDADDPEPRGDDRAKLERLARGAAPGEAAIVVSGGGTRAGLAMERARRVAAALVGGGLPPTRIAIEMGGESDVVVVYEAGT